MNTKSILVILAVIVVAILAGLFLMSPRESIEDARAGASADAIAEGATEVASGTYAVVPAESQVGWAGKKPLIEGYVNSGSIAVSSGAITVTDASATGTFVIDMTTLSVSSTPTKPGKESALEGHLQSDRWFDVATYPTASFVITEIARTSESATAFTYTVRGDLTLKGQTHEVTFPAVIYEDAAGRLNARADFEIDRTVWGLTYGSASFFDDVADNAIDNMVALSMHIVAERQ